MSIRDTIQAASDIEKEIVEVPQWGVTVEVRSMSAKARARLVRQAATDAGVIDLEKFNPAVLIASCFDAETGEPVFSDGDAGWLADKSAAPVEKLAQIGMRLSGMTKDAVEEGKDAS